MRSRRSGSWRRWSALRPPAARSTGGDHKLDAATFKPVAAERARGYLGEMIREMLTGAADAAGRPTGVHPYLLPCEAVFKARTGQKTLVEAVEDMRDLYFERPWLTFSSVHGPVPEAVERHDPPAPAEARKMADHRFGLFFDLLEARDGEAAP